MRKFSISGIVPSKIIFSGKNVAKVNCNNKQVWPNEWATIIDMSTTPSIVHGSFYGGVYSGRLLSYANTAVKLFDGPPLEVAFEAQLIGADAVCVDWQNLFAFGMHYNECCRDVCSWLISAMQPPASDKRWHSYRISCDGSTLKLYIDSSLRSTEQVSAAMRAQNGLYFFGGGYMGELTGKMKNLLVRKYI